VPGPYATLDEVLSFLTAGDAAGKAWLENWMAFAVQNPARRMKTVPVVYGAQGTGKSLLVRVMSDLIGTHNSTAIRNEDLQGRFTSHFVTKLFVSVAEIQTADVGHATANLKYLTGEPTLMLEAKGANAVPVKSAIKMICTSNQTLPVLVEGSGDQRWSLFKQLTPPSDAYLARTAALFDRATNDWSAAGQGELSGLLAYLLALPVNVELAMTPYRNAARDSAAEASRSSVESFVEAVTGSSIDAMFLAHVPDYEKAAPAFANLDVEGHPELTSVAAVQGIYRAYCKSSGLMPLGTNKLGAELERYAPSWVRHKVASSTLSTRPWALWGLPRQLHLRPYRQGAQQLPLAPASSHPSLARAAALVQGSFFPAEPDEEVES
jgi:phage/plasmid-associated DNA primase